MHQIGLLFGFNCKNFDFKKQLNLKIMKNLKNTFAILITVGLVLLADLTFASGKDSVNCLQLNGRVHKAFKQEKGGYTVELIQNNTVIGYQMVKPKMDFVFDLPKNSKYILRVSKPGFLPFVIDIDTKLIEDNSKTYEFNFEAELVPLSVATNYQKKTMGESIAVLKHDEKKDVFFPIEFGSEVSSVF
jgi:hypothetical protein